MASPADKRTISIHTASEGGDIDQLVVLQNLTISIHTASEGGDILVIARC